MRRFQTVVSYKSQLNFLPLMLYGIWYMPEYSHDPDESDNFPGLPDDLDVLQLIEEDGQVEGDDGQHVHHVHRVLEEPPLPRKRD